jgi:glycosyltransferase involved in cell wall biosynthesis
MLHCFIPIFILTGYFFVMRILYLIKNFDFGGAENHVLDLANSMASLGNEVYLITKKGLQSNRLNSKVKFIPLRMTDILLPFQVIFICLVVAKYRIEIMHAHKRLAILQASFAGKIMNVPVVATVHGRTKHDLRSWFSRRIPDRIIFVSGRTIEANRHLKEFRHKSVLIHNAVEINDCVEERDYFSVLYVCRIDKKHASVISMLIKDVLPEIITGFPLVTFNIVGDGKYLEILEEDAEKLNIQNNREICRFYGYIPEVKPMVCRSGIVLGVGRVALEALSCSVPVISLNRLFMGKQITRENYEFYQFNNFVAIAHDAPEPQKLRGLLNDYLSDPSYWHEEAKELQRSVAENLSLEKISANIQTLYMDTCKSRKSISVNFNNRTS